MMPDLFIRFGVALLIGTLIGLEREHTFTRPDVEPYAGVRTFALMALLGCLSALIADTLGSPWPLMGVLLILGIFLAIAYAIAAWRADTGLTTEVSALVTVLLGALCYWDYIALAVAIAVTTTVLLSLKLELHAFAHKITREDVYATLRFAVITAILLPILPNQSYGPPPFDVLNPYRIGLMVVLISGISFTGYVLTKFIDPRMGIGITGFLGGLVSSTAVTLSFAQRSRQQPALSKSFALAIIAAWTIMFLRVMIEIAAVNVPLLRVAWIPFSAAAVAGVIAVAALYFGKSAKQIEDVKFSNPFELGPAFLFGLLYAVILVVSRTAELYLGNAGLYLSSAVSGIADVDAITLSVAELSKHAGGVDLTTATRAIVIAAIANTSVKAGIVFVTGVAALKRYVLLITLLVLGSIVAATMLF